MKRIVIALIFMLCAAALPAHAEASLGCVCVNTDSVSAVIGLDGAEIIAPNRFSRILPLLDGSRFAVRSIMEETPKYALADAQGNLLTQFGYDMIGESCGRLIYHRGDYFGLLSPDGAETTGAEWTQLITLNGRDWIGTRTELYDDEPDTLFHFTDDMPPEALELRVDKPIEAAGSGLMRFRAASTKRYGYLDETGTVRVEARFDTAGDFVGGRCVVSTDGRYGLIDPDGEWLLMPEYDFICTGDALIAALRDGACSVYAGDSLTEVYSAAAERVELVADWVCLRGQQGSLMYRPATQTTVELSDGDSIRPGCEGEIIWVNGSWGSACERVLDEYGRDLSGMMQYLTPIDDTRYLFAQFSTRSYYSSQLDSMRLSADYQSMRCGVCESDGTALIPAEYLSIYAAECGYYVLEGEQSVCVADPGGTVVWSWPVADR